MENNKYRSRRKPGARKYADYSKEMLEVAADLVRNKVISSYDAEKQFAIPRRTIVNRSKSIHTKAFGRPTELSTSNIYLQPLALDSQAFVHCLKDLPKSSEMNIPFYYDIPESLQLNIPKNYSNLQTKSPSKKNPAKIKITSNIVIKEASPEKNMVLQEIDTQINKRKRKQANISHLKSSKKKKKIKRVYDTDSSLTPETSFHASDDSDYEHYDNYIASCLQEQEDQENVCPFGLSNIEFLEEDPLGFQENSWVIVKFATKKSVKHFIGKVFIMNNKIPTVKFTRKVKNSKCDKGTVFTYPNIEDVCAVQDLNDIVTILPNPQITRRGQFIFNVNLDKYNIQ